MRYYVVGRDADGASMIVETRDIDLTSTGADGNAIDRFLFLPGEVFSAGLDAGIKDSHFHPIAIGDGEMRWTAFQMGPNHVSEMHHTDTYDFNLVISGETKVVLGKGEVRLGPGDMILQAGLEHKWVAGPKGCVLVSVLRGLKRQTQS